MMRLLCGWNIFSEPLLFKDTCFFQSSFFRFRKSYFSRRCRFFEQLISDCQPILVQCDTGLKWVNLVFTIILIYHLVINPTNTGVFRHNLTSAAQSGCTSQKTFLLNPWTKILHHIYVLSAALNRTIYRKM